MARMFEPNARRTLRLLLAVVLVVLLTTALPVSADGPPDEESAAWAALRARVPSEAPVYRPTWLPARFRTPLPPAPGPYVGVTYRGEDGDLLAFTIGPTNSARPTRTEPVRVHGHDGRLVFADDSPPLQVVWVEGGQQYSVRAETGGAGRATATREELLRIVANLAPVGPDGMVAGDRLPTTGGLPVASGVAAAALGLALLGAGLVTRRAWSRSSLPTTTGEDQQ